MNPDIASSLSSGFGVGPYQRDRSTDMGGDRRYRECHNRAQVSYLYLGST